jgi:hypothetical protein
MHTKSTSLHKSCFHWFLYTMCFLNVVIFILFFHKATLSNFVIFEKIESWLKDIFERDCKCETKLWGIAILNVSWKALKMVIIHKEFNYICEPCKVSTSLIETTSPLIISFFKAIGYKHGVIIQNCKLYLNCVVWGMYKCWNVYMRGFDEVGDIASSVKKIARV